MPELPEVEIVRRQLEDKIVGKVIADIEVRAWKSVKNYRYFIKELVGATFQSIERKGKYLFFTLISAEDEKLYIIGHLKMTGRLIFETPSAKQKYCGWHKIPSSDSNRTAD